MTIMAYTRTAGPLRWIFIPTICFCVIFNAFASRNDTTAVKKACKDKLSRTHCKMLEAGGACQTSIKRMMGMCPRTCHFCDEYCKDFLPFLCPWWAFHHACYTHARLLNVYCRRSCRKCGPAQAPPKKVPCELSQYGCCWDMKTPITPDGKCPDCEDGSRFCKSFLRHCFYGRNKEFMQKTCPKTCDRCKPLKA